MNIAIEATLAQGQKTGLGNYIGNLLEHLSLIDKENKYFLLYSTKEWNGLNYSSNFIPISYYSFKQSIGIYFRLNSILQKLNADIFHATCTTGCPPKPNIPVISTIHDIFPLIEINASNKKLNFFFKNLVNLTAKYSNYFIYNSQSTQQEFCRYFQIPKPKGEVVYLGPSFKSENIVQRSIKGPILCVGAIEKRKNQFFLLDMYAKALELNFDLPELIFIGPQRNSGELFAEKIISKNLSSKVKWLKYISDEELMKYYSTASLMLYPSKLEGFGIPLVDAINSNLPVICSDIPIFHEIGEDYPIFAKCSNLSDWASKILKFYQNPVYKPELSSSLITKFNWKSSAEKTLEIYKQIINH